jgi:xylitol oxidase
VSDLEPERPQNWARNVTFTPDHVDRPGSLEELQELVARSRNVGTLGTGHSFNRIADSRGSLVSVAGLPPVLEVSADRLSVTVSAGLRYGEVATFLHGEGLALHNLGSLPHISVGGACATGTHGSGDGNGILATAVSAFDLVTGDGSVLRLARSDGERFRGAVVGLGALGVVTRVTLDVQPAFDMRQTVYEDLPYSELDAHFDEVVGAAYSVSLFTDWQGDSIGQVWRKHRVDAHDASWRAEPTWLGATLATSPHHPLPGLAGDTCTQQLGVPGPWFERLPHFRLEFTPSFGDELQSEYLIPRELAVEAGRAVAGLGDLLRPVLLVSEIRTVAADDLWLSPAHGRDSVAFHFTWVKEPAAVANVLPPLEQRLAPFGARPHWGKVFTTSRTVLLDVYPRLRDFARLAAELDPEGKFRNDFLDEVLGEVAQTLSG